MTIGIGNGDFSQDGNVDPGNGWAYYTYTATVPGGEYDVVIDPDLGENDTYWVLAMDSAVGSGADTVQAGQAGTFEAAAGDDVLLAMAPRAGSIPPTRLFGGEGNDQVNPGTIVSTGNVGLTEAYGGGGDDTLNGGNEADTLSGDAYDGFTGNPLIASFDGAPYDTQNDGNDLLSGFGGDDSLSGDGGDDQLFGGDGADTLTGGDGNDFLFGGPRGAGNLDVLSGGDGADSFLLSYTEQGPNGGSGFWSAFAQDMASDIAENDAQTAISDALKDATEALASGILAASLGAVGGALAQAFVAFVESLIASSPPANPDQDVLVVRDFDPREDVLILPVASSAMDSNGLTATVVSASLVPGGFTSDYPVLQFTAGSKVYAYVELSENFVTAMGSNGDQDGMLGTILTTVAQFKSTLYELDGKVGLTNLVSTDVSNALPGGGFVPQDANLPADSTITMFGALGGTIMSNNGSVLAGTNYADALSVNATLVDPDGIQQSQIDGDKAYVHGFGGDDLLYGSLNGDTLAGDDGNDALYSFGSPGAAFESLSGGAGDDTLYGGNSAGAYDGGEGNDTFVLLHVSGAPTMQLEIDLTSLSPAGAPFAAERETVPGGAAPAGSAPPFNGWSDAPVGVMNRYTLSGIENVIGGAMNDWIRGTNGSVLEGAAGADYLNADAGGVTLSYNGSSADVAVAIFADSATASGGDADGDVIAFDSAGDITGLIGSAVDLDMLGGYSDGSVFTFTGNGGSNLFQLLGVGSGVGQFAITDFGAVAPALDLIDLRLLGITAMSQLSIDANVVTVKSPSTGDTIAEITLLGFTGTLSASDFFLAEAVDGAAQAARGGAGLSGGDGADSLRGSTDQDFLLGNGAADLAWGRAGNDVLDGGAASDVLHGGQGADRLLGGEGDDAARGGQGADRLLGDAGSDSLRGGAGDDVLLGGEGQDSLIGGEGNDTLDAGPGADLLRGGAGADSFLLRFGALDGDRIVDFSRDEGDQLHLLAETAVTVQALGQGRFTVSDGTLTETLIVHGALASDFLL